MLETMVQEVESKNQQAFESYFDTEASIVDYSVDEKYNFTSPEELYNFFRNT